MSATLELAQALIQRPSTTPDDAGCQMQIAERLAPLGFVAESMPFGEVTNLWCRRGRAAPLFCFAGHTDVVPTGPLERWIYPPFSGTVVDGVLYGRGSADMKGGIAAFVTAVERFVAAHPDHLGSIALLLTSDEEGPALDGTVRVVERLQQRGEAIDWCLLGEPSSVHQLGDGVKNGRRGSLSAKLTIHGTQGHVAYPHLADNPIHRAAPFLAALTALEWDRGNDYFPPTTLQISNIHAGTGAGNVIPAACVIDFNLRFSTEQSPARIEARVAELLQHYSLSYAIEWTLSGAPYLTEIGSLVKATTAAIEAISGITANVNTGGGTSDGRFIAPSGAQVVEFGLLNATIHQLNEQIAVTDLERLSAIYERILQQLLLPS